MADRPIMKPNGFKPESGDGEFIPCLICGHKAVIKDGENYYCSRDWEYHEDGGK